MKNMTMLFLALTILAGCSFFKQAVSDYQTGKNTPIATNEVAPKDQAAQLSGSVASVPVPFAPIASTIVGLLATIFFTWQRGISIRNSGGVVTASTTTTKPASIVNTIVQDIANVAAGAFTTINSQNATTTGTVIQRVWKVALATVASGVAVASTDSSLQAYLTAHPITSALFVALTSGIAGVEKALSNVQPIVNVTTTTTPSA